MRRLDQWLECRTAEGLPLPVEKCNRYRLLRGLPLLESSASAPGTQAQSEQRAQPSGGSRCPLPAPTGPGIELAALLESLGIDASMCLTGCSGRSATMNAWGVDGCRDRIDEIAGWLVAAEDQNAKRMAREEARIGKTEEPPAALIARCKNRQRCAVAWNAMRTLTWIDPRDPHRSLVETAISRAEAKQGACCTE